MVMTAAGAGGNAQDHGEAADKEDQLEEGEAAGEAVRIKVPKAIAAPTQAEVEEHRLSGHAVYRSWCSSCVRGRGQSNHHQRPGAHADERGDVPVVSMDYCYLGTKTAEEDAEDEASGTSPVRREREVSPCDASTESKLGGMAQLSHQVQATRKAISKS